MTLGRGLLVVPLVVCGCVPWTVDPREQDAPTNVLLSRDRLDFAISVSEDREDVATVTLVNDSDAPTLVWNYGTIEGDDAFSVSDELPGVARLEPHGRFDVPVRFRPDQDGTFDGLIRVMREHGEPLVITLHGRGWAPNAAMLPAGVLDTAVGCSSPVELTLRNDGSEALELEFPPQDSGAFHLVGDVPAMIMPGYQATIDLDFVPLRTGVARADLSFLTNSPGQDPLIVGIQGRGIDGALVSEHWHYGTGAGLGVLVLADLGKSPGWTSRFSNELQGMLDALDGYGVAWRVTSTSTQAICPSFPTGYGVPTDPRYAVLGDLRSTLFNGTNGAYADRLVDLTRHIAVDEPACFGGFAVPGQPLLVVLADDGDDESSADALAGLRNSPAEVHFAPFVPGSVCGMQTPRYDLAVTETRGVDGDLCAADWAADWDAVARAAAGWEGGPTTFILENEPRTGTLSVEVDGRVSANYSYDPYTRMISFRSPLPIGADVVATYLPTDACPE